MKKFISTLIKSVVFSWLAMFLLIEPFSVMVLAALGGLGLVEPSLMVGAVTIYGLTALLFGAILIHAYADKLASWGAVLRMRWDLRGVGKD